MKIIIATDGGLNVEKTAELAVRLVGDGSITVLTVVEVPRSLLADLRGAYGERPPMSIDADAEYVGSAPPAPTLAASWPGDDAMIQRYVETQTEQRTAKLVAAIGALGHTAQVVAEEGENAVADILAACRDRGADILIVGTHGRGRFEGLLGSVSTKLSRSAGCSVLLVR
ncbi:MAG: universal stress protein [Acidimicrobiia bacterium]|nr:universal stress protein [Acidimicrobiia bacterium]